MVISFSVGHLLRFAGGSGINFDLRLRVFSGRSGRPENCFYVRFCPDSSNSLPFAHQRCPAALLLWHPMLLPSDRFEQEVTSLENRRIALSQSPIIFYLSSSIRRWKTLSQDFAGLPGRQLRVRRFAPDRLPALCLPPGLTA